MSTRDDLLGRLKELHTGEETRRSTARAIRKMINHGDLAGAATALDDLETALHPALAVGGNGGGIAVPVPHLLLESNNGSTAVNVADGEVKFDTMYDRNSGSSIEVAPDGMGLELVEPLSEGTVELRSTEAGLWWFIVNFRVRWDDDVMLDVSVGNTSTAWSLRAHQIVQDASATVWSGSGSNFFAPIACPGTLAGAPDEGYLFNVSWRQLVSGAAIDYDPAFYVEWYVERVA